MKTLNISQFSFYFSEVIELYLSLCPCEKYFKYKLQKRSYNYDVNKQIRITQTIISKFKK